MNIVKVYTKDGKFADSFKKDVKTFKHGRAYHDFNRQVRLLNQSGFYLRSQLPPSLTRRK